MAHPIGKKEDKLPSISTEIDLVLHIGLPGQYEEEVVKGFKVSFNEKGDLLLHPIINALKSQRFNITGAMVCCFSPSSQHYELCGSEPLLANASMPASCIESGVLKLKFRVPQRTDYVAADPSANFDERHGRANRRTKERKIGFIIEKVARWRNLYNGVSTGRGETVRMTLEEAALQVGISKKSLDDYLLQLRFGRRFGFNFQEHCHEKVGLLRSYVKDCKKIQTEISKVRDDKLSDELKEHLNANSTAACKTRNCCAMTIPERLHCQ